MLYRFCSFYILFYSFVSYTHLLHAKILHQLLAVRLTAEVVYLFTPNGSLYFIFTFFSFVCFVPIVATHSLALSFSLLLAVVGVDDGVRQWSQQQLVSVYYASRTQRHIEFSHRRETNAPATKTFLLFEILDFQLCSARHTVELIISNADLELWEISRNIVVYQSRTTVL